MKHRIPRSHTVSLSIVTMAFLIVLPAHIHARGGRGQAPATARAAAPIDLTGYWVSVVSEDWRWRMVTPPKGSFPSIPLNADGHRVANAWDPVKDEAEGNQCKAYGAAAIMRMPGRLHITWENDNTLRIDTDAGVQTRLFHFGEARPPTGAPAWQGHSVARWEFGGAAAGRFGEGGGGGARGGRLKVGTTHMRPGYLQKNGVPYSGNAVVTEYFELAKAPSGDVWLIVTTIVDDPQYLAVAPPGTYGDQYGPFIRTSNFKKLPDASGWNPTPCSAR